MKKLFLTIILALSTSASGSCHLFGVKGFAKFEEGELYVVVHEGSDVERKLKLPLAQFDRIAPYLDLTLSGDFILSSNTLEEKVLPVKSFRNLNFESPDPLNQVEHSYLKHKGETPCP